MKDETEQTNDQAYTRRSASYKAEALKLVDRIGYAEAARQLGLHEQLYGWRAKQAQQLSSVLQLPRLDAALQGAFHLAVGSE
ncbi:hypothetical protein RCS87_19230 [Thiothrix lacustris]|nr:hypothetical protein [Thiothrix lacustris]WMP19380.1 hypothetical protein RCS87_19230 [Thiothrix lacustris]